MRFSILATAALIAAAADPAQAQLKQSNRAGKSSNNMYTVSDSTQATFTNRLFWDFSAMPDNTPIPGGLITSGYSVKNEKKVTTHAYQVANTFIKGKYLNLKVPGGQTAMPYKSAEVVSAVTNIFYASVRTVAIFSEPAGVCNGIFFYKNDNQETDIEWLSDKNSQSNAGTRRIWFANQENDGDGKKTFKQWPIPSNPTTTEHEYRIDWVKGMTKFYIDSVLVWTMTTDVPTVPGPWVWNNWANGDKGWSAGPPATDAFFKIREIDMYFNTSSSK